MQMWSNCILREMGCGDGVDVLHHGSCIKEDLTYFGKPVGEGDISSEHSMMREDCLLGKKATDLFTGRGFCVLL